MERIPKGIYTQEFREQAIRLVEGKRSINRAIPQASEME